MIKDNFDQESFEKRVQYIHDEYEIEINLTKDARAEALLLTNYVESVLKDCIVLLFRSLKARGIPRKIMVSILEDKEIFEKSLAQDILRCFDIRDKYGHNISMDEIAKDVKSIFESMDEFKIWNLGDDEFHTWKLDQRLFYVINGLQNELQRTYWSIVVNSKEKDALGS